MCVCAVCMCEKKSVMQSRTDKEKMSCVMALYNNYIIYRMQV